MATVALDALGADRGPREVARGAALAAREGLRLRIVGPEAELSEAAEAGAEVVPCDVGIANDEDPVRAVREKRDASIVRACQEVAEGRADAVVSCGSTGAALAAATFGLRRIRGVRRPALCAQIPTPSGTVLLLDAGASVEARARHLVQFAYLGSAFAGAALGLDRPRVGLLTVGEEDGKGTPEVVEAAGELRESSAIDFHGNVEGNDIPLGTVDVVVTGGFAGNIALKAIEGTARVVAGAVSDAARSNPPALLGGLLLRPALGGLRRDLDPNQVGGALLLGLRSVCVVGHGSATAEGVLNACRLAGRCVDSDAVGRSAGLLRDAGALGD